jgi:hypothetical protein
MVAFGKPVAGSLTRGSCSMPASFRKVGRKALAEPDTAVTFSITLRFAVLHDVLLVIGRRGLDRLGLVPCQEQGAGAGKDGGVECRNRLALGIRVAGVVDPASFVACDAPQLS